MNVWPFTRDPLASLLHKARKGDREAFRSLYRALYPRVHAFCARRSHDPDEPVARTFHKLVEKLGTFDGVRGQVLPWALSIARNELIDAARAQKPQGELPELVDAATPLSRFLESEELDALRAELRRLDPETRELLSLRFGEELSHKEIAQLTGLSHDAVRQRLSRTLRELRETLHTKGALT